MFKGFAWHEHWKRGRFLRKKAERMRLVDEYESHEAPIRLLRRQVEAYQGLDEFRRSASFEEDMRENLAALRRHEGERHRIGRLLGIPERYHLPV